MAREAPADVERALDVAAEDMTNKIKLSMDDSPRDGLTYRRGSRVHVASTSPNPPRPDIGTLKNSMRWTQDGKLRRRIEDGVEYGVYLEMGTTDIDKRPFMNPMFEIFRAGEFHRILQEELDL